MIVLCVQSNLRLQSNVFVVAMPSQHSLPFFFHKASLIRGNRSNCALFCDNLDWLVSKLDRLEASSGDNTYTVLVAPCALCLFLCVSIYLHWPLLEKLNKGKMLCYCLWELVLLL